MCVIWSLWKIGLQYLKGGHDDLPCVKAFRSSFGKYSQEIRSWLFESITKGDDKIHEDVLWKRERDEL